MAQGRDQIRIGGYDITHEEIDQGVSEAGLSLIMALAMFVGAWSIACMVGGVWSAGGVGQLARAWLTSVTGM